MINEPGVWIPVSAGLPARNGKYLWFGKDGKFHLVKFYPSDPPAQYTKRFSHWQAITPPTKGDKAK